VIIQWPDVNAFALFWPARLSLSVLKKICGSNHSRRLPFLDLMLPFITENEIMHSDLKKNHDQYYNRAEEPSLTQKSFNVGILRCICEKAP